jgi:hypothetical protein
MVAPPPRRANPSCGPPGGVMSPVDPYRLGGTMSTRNIAIAALVGVVVIAVILFVL